MRIPYGKHHITDDDLRAVNEVLLSDYITQGPKVEEFEKAFAEYVGVKYAVAVCNGTAALHICTMAMKVRQGQKVITTPITFVASANCVKFCGGDVYFSDIDPDTYLLDINKLRDLLEAHPKGTFTGIIPVDFAGNPVNMEKIKELADAFDLWIIEDACHAPGASYIDSKGEVQKTGNCRYSDMAIFSFHPVKHIATGEGGMVTTNNKDLYKKLLLLRSHGITKEPGLMHDNHGGWYYEMQELSHNYRLTDFQAALGISQLRRVYESFFRRQEIAKIYDEAFLGTKIRTPELNGNVTHAYHLYVILVPDRRNFYEYLVKNGIFAQIHYIPVHLMPYYKQFGWKEGDFPIAEKYYTSCISLPIYPSLTNEEQNYVIEKVLNFFK